MWSPSRSSAVDPLLKIYGPRANGVLKVSFCLRFFQVTFGAAYRVGSIGQL